MTAPSTPAPAKTDPREKRCAACGGPRAHCGMAGQWFCVEHVPADFWPPESGEEAA